MLQPHYRIRNRIPSSSGYPQHLPPTPPPELYDPYLLAQKIRYSLYHKPKHLSNAKPKTNEKHPKPIPHTLSSGSKSLHLPGPEDPAFLCAVNQNIPQKAKPKKIVNLPPPSPPTTPSIPRAAGHPPGNPGTLNSLVLHNPVFQDAHKTGKLVQSAPETSQHPHTTLLRVRPPPHTRNPGTPGNSLYQPKTSFKHQTQTSETQNPETPRHPSPAL